MSVSEIVSDPGYRGAMPFIIAMPGAREPEGARVVRWYGCSRGRSIRWTRLRPRRKQFDDDRLVAENLRPRADQLASA